MITTDLSIDLILQLTLMLNGHKCVEADPIIRDFTAIHIENTKVNKQNNNNTSACCIPNVRSSL